MLSKKEVYLFANWKMYLDHEESVALARILNENQKNFSHHVNMAIFPSALSFTDVSSVLGTNSAIKIGAQNIYWVEKGGYTGEISAQMYQKVGANYALVGHSERRHIFHETNHEIREKIKNALEIGLTPVICVGETERERNDNLTDDVLEIQLRACLEGVAWNDSIRLFIAYEPVWAIGTGVSCDPVEVERVHQIIKKIANNILPNCDPILLYGGSVRSENVVSFLNQENVHGVLVGKISTSFEQWQEVIKKVS
jgi:triosephosphate isomerase